MDKKAKLQMVKKLSEIVSHSQFEELIQEIDNAPDESKRQLAEQICTVDEFAKRGIPIAEDFRITLRTFEGPEIKPEYDELSGKQKEGLNIATICASLGYIACISIGKPL